MKNYGAEDQLAAAQLPTVAIEGGPISDAWRQYYAFHNASSSSDDEGDACSIDCKAERLVHTRHCRLQPDGAQTGADSEPGRDDRDGVTTVRGDCRSCHVCHYSFGKDCSFRAGEEVPFSFPSL